MQCLEKRAEMTCEGPPAADGGIIERLPNLPEAGGADRPAVLMEAQAPGVPGEAAEIDQAAALPLLIGDQRLVVEIEDRIGQYRAPVVHQAHVVPVDQSEMTQIVSEAEAVREVLEIAGQAGVERVAAAVDHPRVRQKQGNKAEAQIVPRRLVDDPARRSALPQYIQILPSQLPRVLAVQEARAVGERLLGM